MKINCAENIVDGRIHHCGFARGRAPSLFACTFMKTLWFAISAIMVATASAHAEKWVLAWSDEFNYQGLPDPDKWDYEEGFVRNHESQYYTRGRLENARVGHGLLTIECRKERFEPENHAPVRYTSASLVTKNKVSWQYGRIELRAKLPRGQGVWPAIWTLGNNASEVGWPACGEIDIMEYIGRDANHIYGTLHYAVDGKHHADQGILETIRPYDNFHIYAVEWRPDRIDFYFDSTKYHTALLDKAGKGAENAFRAPHYLIINFALGGDWGGAVDDSVLPQKFLIDYVRVYKKS
jgi:beta-glucanase (GH16 family)